MRHYLAFQLFVFGLVLSVLPVSQSHANAKYYKQEATINGVKRDYYVYLPSTWTSDKQHPAVIAFHGYESDANGMRWAIKPDKWAEKYGYVMIYPNALNKSWNAGKGFGSANKTSDDLSFAAALPDIVAARHNIDKHKIYAMGFSNGAQVVALMACNVPQKLAAAAIVAHTMNIDGCNPKIKLPMAFIHGAQDKQAPFKGGGKASLASHDDSVSFYLQVNEISSEASVIVDKETIRCKSWSDKGEKAEVRSCIGFDSGHSWPGGTEFMVELLGTVNKELNANDFLFEFFSQHSGKGSVRENKELIRVGTVNRVEAANKASQTSNAKPTSKAKVKIADGEGD